MYVVVIFKLCNHFSVVSSIVYNFNIPWSKGNVLGGLSGLAAVLRGSNSKLFVGKI
jgi:hypothetical protein